MRPANVKSKLRDGDILLLRGQSYNPLQGLIKMVTGSPYTHAAMYANGKIYDVVGQTPTWMGGRKLDHDGGQENTLSEFAKRDSNMTYDVYRPKKRLANIAAKNIDELAKETKQYSVNNLLTAGSQELFGREWFPRTNSEIARICSQLVQDAFDDKLVADGMMSPGAFTKHNDIKPMNFGVNFGYDDKKKSHKANLSIQEYDKTASIKGLLKFSELKKKEIH